MTRRRWLKPPRWESRGKAMKRVLYAVIVVILIAMAAIAVSAALLSMADQVDDWFYIVPGYETGYTEEWGLNADGTAWINVGRAPDDVQYIRVWPDHQGAGPAGEEVVWRITSRTLIDPARMHLRLAR